MNSNKQWCQLDVRSKPELSAAEPYCKFVRLPISDGKLPDIEVFCNWTELRLDIAMSSDGNEPSCRLFDTFRNLSREIARKENLKGETEKLRTHFEWQSHSDSESAIGSYATTTNSDCCVRQPDKVRNARRQRSRQPVVTTEVNGAAVGKRINQVSNSHRRRQ